jgi:hypothetical protein
VCIKELPRGDQRWRWKVWLSGDEAIDFVLNEETPFSIEEIGIEFDNIGFINDKDRIRTWKPCAYSGTLPQFVTCANGSHIRLPIGRVRETASVLLTSCKGESFYIHGSSNLFCIRNHG